MPKPLREQINPLYYMQGGIMVEEIIDAYELNWREAFVLKYLLRKKKARTKAKRVLDLYKLRWYLNGEIDRLGGNKPMHTMED